MTNSDQQDSAGIAYRWWRELNPENGNQSGHQRAALARIRRAASPLEVMLEPEALRLVARLPQNPKRVAALAGILAFVREAEENCIVRSVGRKSLDDDKAVLSEVRFRRLLQAQEDELMDAMRRLVRLNHRRANIYDLSKAILYWGDKIRHRWIFDYYGVADHNGS